MSLRNGSRRLSLTQCEARANAIAHVGLRLRRALIHLLRSAAVLSAFAWGAPASAHELPQVSATGLAGILAPPLLTPYVGNSQGDVTVIEYFDYNCPVCKRTDVELQKLAASDSNVRLVYKDWPIFGAVSVYAAYCSFAAAELGQYPLAHRALINSKRKLDSNEVVDAVLRDAGIDLPKIKSLIAAHGKQFSAALTRNLGEANALRLRGTPGLIVGDILIAGGLDYAQLRRLVSESRNPAR